MLIRSTLFSLSLNLLGKIGPLIGGKESTEPDTPSKFIAILRNSLYIPELRIWMTGWHDKEKNKWCYLDSQINTVSAQIKSFGEYWLGKPLHFGCIPFPILWSKSPQYQAVKGSHKIEKKHWQRHFIKLHLGDRPALPTSSLFLLHWFTSDKVS